MKQIHSHKPRSVKPVIAGLNAAAAEANIRRKLSILAEALAQSTRPSHVRGAWAPDMTVAIANRAFPTTVRQFNLWNSEILPGELKGLLPSIHSNASVTLKRNASLSTSVEDMVGALRKALLTPTPESRRAGNVASLRRRIAAAGVMRQIAERELVASRREVLKLTDLLKQETMRREAIERESKASIQELEKQLVKLHTQKKLSAKMFTKVTLTQGTASE